MTIYGVERKYRFGEYLFQVAYDSGNEASFEQRDIHWSISPGDPHWVRSFYFKDVNEHHMKAFCKRFAEDESYRKNCLEQTTDWAIRDRLFRRNIFTVYWQDSPLVEQVGGVPEAYSYIKKHWKAIVALEEYQRIQRIDSTFTPSQGELDPEIRDAVECFNQVEGVETKFSCQGITQTILYDDVPILADTPHAYLAYVRFETLPEWVVPVLETYAPTVAQYQPYFKLLESAGDNVQFRQTAVELAQSLIKDV